ncbi:hypothetical protein CC86DRAFT_82429 [Ophiobolus disseminans]|uniref:Uncharacterized protein n=1 Tax=Ophiobolus disseminans TaxID=1469910 RepID=A0A6A7AGS1_9PLEO|nr:hypothetical protein CC86DRAFT_82429 [Ophiobolus disseminans]
MAGPPSNKTTPQKETQKWLSNQDKGSKVDAKGEDQRLASSSSSSSAISSTNAVVGANDTQDQASTFLPLQDRPRIQSNFPPPSPGPNPLAHMPKAIDSIYNTHYDPTARDRAFNTAIDEHLRAKNDIRMERELAEAVAALGVTDDDLIEGIDSPVADNDTSVAAEGGVAIVNTSSHPRDAVADQASSSQDPPARRRMTPLELAIKVNNLLMAFREIPDIPSACYTLSISRAVDVIGSDEFAVAETRAVLRKGTFFAKNAKKVGLPMAVMRWLGGC